MFLFQIGSIKSYIFNCQSQTTKRCFYSKLVRLKVKLDIKGTGLDMQFLFQIGSIKREIVPAYEEVDTEVSIPNWFD